MDICSKIDTSASVDVKSFHEFPVDLSVNDLGNGLSKFLNIQDDKNFVSCSIPVCCRNGVGKEDICEEPHQLPISSSEKFLNKSATFPCPSKVVSSTASINGENEGKAGDGDDDDDITSELLAQNGYIKSVSAPYPRSISLPTHLKPVSALKGSREKQGTPPMKLTVTWAPDVYDPPPTAVSHVVTNKSQRHRNDNKKNAKNKHKGSGKPFRGSRGKDKKQARKFGGSSNRCFKSLDDDERVVDQVEPQADIVDFNIGGPDPYCGTSFLKDSVTKLHFSVAEAT